MGIEWGWTAREFARDWELQLVRVSPSVTAGASSLGASSDATMGLESAFVMASGLELYSAVPWAVEREAQLA